MQSQGQRTGIEVRAGFFPLAFLFLFCTPRIIVDGQEHKLAWWKTHFFALGPGKHTISFYLIYMFLRQGKASAEIHVAPGSVSRIRYRPTPLMFAPGRIKVE